MFTQTVDVNIKGAVHFVRAISAAMAAQDELTHVSSGRHGNTTRSLGRGSVVLLGSVMSYIAGPGMLNYTTSKHAIIGVTKSAGKPSQSTSPKIGTPVNDECPKQKQWTVSSLASGSTPSARLGSTRR